ncbi:MAG: cation:proton antiporter [Clostridia bacterium]|nr:cation:proton antiporter [Clostridia bacterium]MBR2987542.1 cation:proton antiporter [Clostridia bacterium]
MTQTASVFLSLSIAMLAGLLLSRLAKLVKLPSVTAYLISGVLIGPFVLGAIGIQGIGITSEQIEGFGLIADLALGFIAFSMGNEFRLSQLKKIGKQATVIGVLQALITTVVVDIALIALHFAMPDTLSIPAAIVLASVATATAPAATLMVVKQYRAKGPVTDVLLPVVALDDAVGLVVFAISFGIARSMVTAGVSPLAIILEPLLEIVLSLLLGFVMGLLFTLCERYFHSRSKRMAVSVTFVMLTVAISSLKFEIPGIGIHIGFSSLLACMMLGTVFCNICEVSEELMDRSDRWTTPVLILFFVISGAELDLSVFSQWAVVVVGIVYIIARSLGKYYGANISAKMTKSDPNIVKYLGITLLPQAGVALGMAIKAVELGPDGAIVRNITLFAVLIYEIVGPFLTKMALTKAGDIKEEGRRSARNEHLALKTQNKQK